MRKPRQIILLGYLISLLLVLAFLVAWRAGYIVFTNPHRSVPVPSTSSSPLPLAHQSSPTPTSDTLTGAVDEPLDGDESAASDDRGDEPLNEEELADDSVQAADEEREAPQEPEWVEGGPFFVYKERGSRLNHYIPSGWAGDYGDLKFNQGWMREGEDTCIQIRYTAEGKQGAGWAGIHWQHPANNWGDKKGGYDLSGYSQLRFSVRGESGGETVKFGLGGINGQTQPGDSANASLGPLRLTPDWQTMTIDLTGFDLRHIIAGFRISFASTDNPSGCTIYLDDIRFEKPN